MKKRTVAKRSRKTRVEAQPKFNLKAWLQKKRKGGARLNGRS